MSLLEPITIKYVGGWADEHRLPLREFARSADGLDDILGFCAEFAITQRVILRRTSRTVRLVTQAPVPGSFEFIPLIEAVSQSPLVISASNGLFGVLVGLVFATYANKNKQKILEQIIHDLMQQIGHNNEHTQKLIKMFLEKLEPKRPAAIRSVAAISSGCDEMVINAGTRNELVLNARDRTIIELGPEAEIEPHTARVKITELDRVTGGCKVSFEGENKRFRGAVLDPAIRVNGNVYGAALSEGQYINVEAEFSIVEGEIKKVLILRPATD